MKKILENLWGDFKLDVEVSVALDREIGWDRSLPLDHAWKMRDPVSKLFKYASIKNSRRDFFRLRPQVAPNSFMIDVCVLMPSRLRSMTGGAIFPQQVCIYIWADGNGLTWHCSAILRAHVLRISYSWSTFLVSSSLQCDAVDLTQTPRDYPELSRLKARAYSIQHLSLHDDDPA